MADKRITELQLIGSVVDGISVPGDNGIQTYRFTTTQLKAYILANQAILLAMLKDDIFTGLTGVTPAGGDYFPLVDASDSNKTKKALLSDIRNAVYRAVTTTDTPVADDETMKLSGASFTVTLPTAAGITGKRYKFVHAGTSLSQVYTFNTTSSQTIGGIASGSIVLRTAGEVLHVESDGANWIIVARYKKPEWEHLFFTASYNTGGHASGTGEVDVVFNTAITDPASAYNNSTGEYTVPLAGKYLITSTLRWAATASLGTAEARIKKNGTLFFAGTTYSHSTNSHAPSVTSSVIANLAASDVIKVTAIRSVASNGLLNSADYNQFQMTRLSD